MIMIKVTVEVAILLTGLLADEGADTPAGKYLITCIVAFNADIILTDWRRISTEQKKLIYGGILEDQSKSR